MLNLDKQFKKWAMFLVMGAFLVIGFPCEGEASEQAVSAVSSSSPELHTSDTILLSLADAAEADKIGEGLLTEYDVQDNQTIRFPYKGYLFESHGDCAITSVNEVRSKYPDWPVPEKLGSYQFVDFTLYHKRTSVVPPNIRPRPKDTIEVLTDKEAAQQYYLCYQNGSNQFRVNVLPITDTDTEDRTFFEDIRLIILEFAPFPSHPRAYFESQNENSTLFRSLWISPETNGKYAFYIHKISGSDCLESENVPFTKEEASSIYKAIEKDFSKISLQ